MKRLAASLALVLALCSSGLIYPATLEVEKTEGEILCLTTASGVHYELVGAEDYEEGDLVSAIMFTRRTEKITDDVIIASRWSGYNTKGGDK